MSYVPGSTFTQQSLGYPYPYYPPAPPPPYPYPYPYLYPSVVPVPLPFSYPIGGPGPWWHGGYPRHYSGYPGGPHIGRPGGTGGFHGHHFFQW